jgi:hypothetical protein
MILVRATREGLSGRHTATGMVIDRDGVPTTQDDFFCALPSVRALRRIVRIINPATAAEVTCPVLDVGPWEEHDEDYVFGNARPAAESGTDSRGRKTNHAGIDLSDGVWKALSMTDNDDVLWEFVHDAI